MTATRLDLATSFPDSGSAANAKTGVSALGWLYSFVVPHRVSMLVLLLLSVTATGLVLVQPYLTKRMIDEGLLAGDFQMLLSIAATLLGIGLVSTLLAGINRYYHTRLSGRILFALREAVYGHLQRLSPAFYGQRRCGDLLARLDGDVAEIQRFAVDGLFSAISGVLGLLGAVAMLVWLNWRLALAMVVLVPLHWGYLRYMRPRVVDRTRQLRERSADISSFLVETLGAMKFIQSVGAEQREAQRLQRLNRSYLHDLLGLQLLEFATSSVPNTLTTLFRAAAFVLGGYWVIAGQMELGALIAFTTYLGMAVGPVHTLLGLYMAVHRMRVSLDRVCELTHSMADVEDAGERSMPATVQGDIRFEQLEFGYPGADSAVFQQLDGRFPGGARIGLAGASGVGKSTLTDLLLRHFDPDRGRILLDGVDLRAYRLTELRQRIAVVSQDIVLFRGSIEDNVRYANPCASSEAVSRALQQAGLDEFARQLVAGDDRRIGERGSGLSGGQRQRIAIARALLQDPAILILDEATSAVDPETETRILETVESLFSGRTLILISHQTHLLQRLDYLARVEQGRLVISRQSGRGATAP